MSELSEEPLGQLLRNLNQTLAAARKLLEDPKIGETIQETRDAMAASRRLVVSIEQKLEPLSASLLAASDGIGAAADEAGTLFAEGRTAISSIKVLVVSANDAITNAERVLASVNNTIEPGSPIFYRELVAALRQISSAARSLRSLSETLERNPDSILFGR
jgi:paraquat-inducible protein B